MLSVLSPSALRPLHKEGARVRCELKQLEGGGGWSIAQVYENLEQDRSTHLYVPEIAT